MRFRTLVLVGVVFCAVALPRLAQADQPRDYYLAARPEGNYILADVIAPGAVQATFENRRYIYGKANEFTLKANAIAAWPFGGADLGFDLRLIVLSLGGSVGFQNTWRNFTFADDQPIHRRERRQADAAGEFNNALWGYAEGRVQLALPFNKFALFNSVAYFRLEDSPDRTLDWRQNVVHDGGLNIRWETQLFVKHYAFGGLAPMVQVLNYPLGGERETLFNYGAMFVTRPGLKRRDDLLFLQVLVNTSGNDVYGAHIYRAPMTLLMGYRSILTL